MTDEISMCTALKFKNFVDIIMEDEGNPLEKAVEEFEGEVLTQTITGTISGESHGVFYMYRDGSVAGIFGHGIVLSDPQMVLHGYVKTAIAQYDEQNGGADRIRHDG